MNGCFGKTWRIQLENNTGVTLATSSVLIKCRLDNFTSSGQLNIQSGTETTLISNTGATIADAAFSNSSTQDNSSALYLGGAFVASVTTTGSPSGSVTIRVQHSLDGGTTWPDNGSGSFDLFVIEFTAAGTKVRSRYI